MRKFLSVIAWAVAAVALIIGGIVCFVHYGHVSSVVSDGNAIENFGMLLGLGIGLFGGGVAAAIGCLASFFTAKTKDK